MTMTNQSYLFTLPDSKIQITLLYLPSLDLYVITDAKGFGQTWVRVTYCRQVYETKLLMGIDEFDIVTSIARHLSEGIVKRKLRNCADELAPVKEINLTFSISLRNKNPDAIRLIKEEFDKHLNV